MLNNSINIHIYRKELDINMSLHYMFKSTIAFFSGVFIALTLLFSGTAFANLIYQDHNDNSSILTLIDSSGTPQTTNITADYIFSFTHNGNPRLLTADTSGNIAVYNPADLSAPLSSGTLTTSSGNFEPLSVA